MFEAEELRRMAAAGEPLRAMVLLGINCGFGLSGPSSLPVKATGLEAGWIDFPRPKTGIPRRIPIWSETVESLLAAATVRARPADPEHAGLAFLSPSGRPLVREQLSLSGDEGGTAFRRVDGTARPFKLPLQRLGIDQRNRGFYSLRRTLETAAGETKDQVAVDLAMGHADDSMAAVHRQRIGDDRLRAVTDHVLRWLF